MADEPVPQSPLWGDPREGKPFGDADRGDDGLRVVGGVRGAVEVPVPRGLSDATVLKPQYIETDDEPWHSTCRSAVTITKAQLDSGYSAGLPFIVAEDALGAATREAKNAKDVEKAIATALAAGARAGCPAIKDAEKVIKAFAKGDDEVVSKAKPKAPKVAAQGKGWDDMKRELGKTHDNSVA